MKVKCIDASFSGGHLKEGEVYDVIESKVNTKPSFHIVGTPVSQVWYQSRFEKVEE